MIDPDIKDIADKIWALTHIMLKLILSTDGKHSVWVEVEDIEDEEHLKTVYESAKKLYEWILEDYGTKADMWGEAINKGKEKGPDCPLCNEAMIRRKGARGDFWGCSQFPKCRGTREITS